MFWKIFPYWLGLILAAIFSYWMKWNTLGLGLSIFSQVFAAGLWQYHRHKDRSNDS